MQILGIPTVHRHCYLVTVMRRAVVASILLAALSLLVVAPAPSYDPWAWVLWGDQVAGDGLRTLEGPSFKPLPVAVCALLVAFGPAAPWLWVLVARVGAALAVLLAFRVGRQLAGGSVLAGVLAAVGVALSGGYLGLAAAGASEGLLLASTLAGAEAWRRGRPRWALACGVAAALVRVETWLFLLAAGVLVWRRRPQDRPLLVAAAVFIPVAWILPEMVGSGQALRSAARARVPNPGQPGLSDTPVLASLRAAVALPLWPLWAGVALGAWSGWRRRDRATRALLAPATAGLAWMGLVAAMAAAGFSGEPRYALPGAALVAVSGAAGLVVACRRTARAAPGAARGLMAGTLTLLLVAAGATRAGEAVDVPASQAYQWRLQADLAAAVAGVGGPDDVLACGRPHVGPLRGPLLAYHLGVARSQVEPDRAPEAPGMVFRSALHPGDPPAPAVPVGFHPVAEVGRWQVFADCNRPADRSLSR